jgi:hypothetical protein
MFSALKFVVAGVIVALFGGFLLAGVLTTQQGDEMAPAAATASPSPTTNTDILPGVTLTVEEVEPGVFRVVNDGVRDLDPGGNHGIAAGYDGNVWLLQEDEFLRLGSEEAHGWPTAFGPSDHDLEVTPDGTVWLVPNPPYRAGWHDMTGDDVLRSADGEEWSAMPCPDNCTGVTVAPDGKAWASWTDGNGVWRVAHLGPESWQPLLGAFPRDFTPGGFERLLFTDAGDIYGVTCGWACLAYRYEYGAWHRQRDAYALVDVGRDGTVWQDGGIGDEVMETSFPGDGLARLAGGGWAAWTSDDWATWTSDDLPDIEYGFGLDKQFEAAPDGSVWFSLWDSADGSDPQKGRYWRWEERQTAVEDGRLACDGLARFDGETLDRFLPGRCISMAIAADGAAWVLDDEEGARDLYVITPEAVAASE